MLYGGVIFLKVLFISEYISAKGQGAYMVANAHYQSFCDIFGEKNIKVISIKTSDEMIDNGKFTRISGYTKRNDRLWNLLCGYPPFYSSKIDKYILDVLSEDKYDLIYFDNSHFGKIIKKIKKVYPKIPIWTFFHGIYSNSAFQTMKSSNFKPQIVISCLNSARQERVTVKYSDKCIVLNERENTELFKYYKRHADMLLPVYFKDTAKIEKICENDEFKILFLGGKFWPNILGVIWFVENVMPKINKKAKLYIVGRGMEILNENDTIKNADNVLVIGGTDDLNYWYNSSHIAVGPIFHGDGMKTKTAEALMYGKKYIGTTEALCGYVGLDGFCCNTAEEFITLINKLIKKGVSGYYPEMRKLYEENYSVEAANKKIIELLKSMEIEHEK